MAILELIMDFTGETDVNPRLGRMVSTDNLGTILTPGYLNAANTFIGALFRETDFLMTSYNANTMPAQITLGVSIADDGTISLAEPNGTGDVIGPSGASDNGLTVFNGTSGTVIKEAVGTGTVQITSGVVSLYSTTPTGQEFINLSDMVAMQTFLELTGAADSLAGYGPTGELANFGLGTGFSIDMGGDLQFDGSFQNPMTTLGDIIVAGASGVANRLGVGANTLVLTADNTAPLGVAWAEASSGFANPMTALGDLIVGGASGVAARLGIGTDGQALQASSIAPDGVTWGAINLASSSSVTGNLAVSHLNGGTNAGSLTFWAGDASWKTAVTSIGATTSSTGLSISGSPITTSGSLTFTLSTALQALATLGASGSTGLIAQTGVNSFVDRIITGTTNQIVVNNGSGAGGDPVISLPSTIDLSNSGQVRAGSIFLANASNSVLIAPSATAGSGIQFQTPPTNGNPNDVLIKGFGSGTIWAPISALQSYQFYQQYVLSNQSQLVVLLPGGPFSYEFCLSQIAPSNGNDQLNIQFSNNLGSTYLSTIQVVTGAYANLGAPTFGIGGTPNQNTALIAGASFFVGAGGAYGQIVLIPAADGSATSFRANTNYLYSPTPSLCTSNQIDGIVTSPGINAIRLFYASSNLSGTVNLYIKNSL